MDEQGTKEQNAFCGGSGRCLNAELPFCRIHFGNPTEEDKRIALDFLYESGAMSEEHADLYRDAFLRVTYADLMDSAEPEARPVATWRGAAGKTAIGRPSKVSNGERDRVKPPRVYRNRPPTFRKSGARRYDRNPYTVGLALLAEMIDQRREEYDAIDWRTDEVTGPNAPFDSDYHGSSDGHHAACPRCSQGRGHVVVGAECSCTRPDREAEYRTKLEDGTAVILKFDRITGEFEGTPGFYVTH